MLIPYFLDGRVGHEKCRSLLNSGIFRTRYATHDKVECSQRIIKASLKTELFGENSFRETVTRIEQQARRTLAILGDLHLTDITDFDMISDSGNRALLEFETLDRHACLARKDGAAPTPGPERADWRQRKQG